MGLNRFRMWGLVLRERRLSFGCRNRRLLQLAVDKVRRGKGTDKERPLTGGGSGRSVGSKLSKEYQVILYGDAIIKIIVHQ